MKKEVFLLISTVMLIYGCEKEYDAAEEQRKPQTTHDIDGNIYDSIYIGNQVWMAENLKTTRYNDGTDIPLVEYSLEWHTATKPGHCWYFNIIPVTSRDNNGALYNWHAVGTGKLCPVGWHVPTDKDWKELEVYIGMNPQEADKQYWRGDNIATLLKEQVSWNLSATGGDNYHFSALPSGFRSAYTGDFESFGGEAYWWTSTAFDSKTAWTRSMCKGYTTIGRITSDKRIGESVRCIKD